MKLSQSQLLMLRVSGRDEETSCGGGVRLMSGRNWHTAYSLVRRGLGRIEDNRRTGKNDASYFFASEAGVAIIYPEDNRESQERKLAA